MVVLCCWFTKYELVFLLRQLEFHNIKIMRDSVSLGSKFCVCGQNTDVWINRCLVLPAEGSFYVWQKSTAAVVLHWLQLCVAALIGWILLVLVIDTLHPVSSTFLHKRSALFKHLPTVGVPDASVLKHFWHHRSSLTIHCQFLMNIEKLDYRNVIRQRGNAYCWQ